MAKDFSNPKKLGFMRVLQFFFAFNVIVTISLLAFLIKGSYELEFSNILDFVNSEMRSEEHTSELQSH